MPVNTLYRAVEIMGRSVEDVTHWGWICGALGAEGKGPKCVNGVLAIAAGHGMPDYISDVIARKPQDYEAMRLVAVTLIETAPAEVLAAIETEIGKDVPEDLYAWQARGHGVKSIQLLGSMLVAVNDYHVKTGEDDEFGDEVVVPYFNKDTALMWFRAAFDKLCEGLPEPLPVEPPLTVEQIVGAAVKQVDEQGWFTTT